MNLKAHRSNFKQLFISIVGICALVCTTGRVALAEDTVDRLDRELKELRQMIDLMVSVPVGTIMAYGGDLSNKKVKDNLISHGWLPCDGTEYSSDDKNGYNELYRAIGTAFGGDKDKGKFNVPDLRGRFVRGADSGTGRDPDAKIRTDSAPGGNKGDNVGSAQEDAFQGHYHETTAINGNTNNNGIAGVNRRIPNGSGAVVSKATKDNVHGDPRISSETRSKNIYVNWIIKAKHTLPTAQ